MAEVISQVVLPPERIREGDSTDTPLFSLLRPLFRGAERTRTADPLLAKQVLYQLSYRPNETPV
jgi:hypothetical protein